jgi:hypothetical protein
MTALSPATSLALFQPAGAQPSVPAVPSAGGGGVDAVTYRIAQQVADGKMSEDQGAALAQAWQQIQDVIDLSAQSGAAAFGPADITQMFDALRPALTQAAPPPPEPGGVDITV